MRKVQLQMQVSLDGFVAGPNGETDWQVSDWDDAFKNYVAELSKGDDLIIYGGATLVSSFIKHNLIDEYNFFVNPIAIGNGIPIFKEAHKLELKLVNAIPFSCGIVAFRYQPATKPQEITINEEALIQNALS